MPAVRRVFPPPPSPPPLSSPPPGAAPPSFSSLLSHPSASSLRSFCLYALLCLLRLCVFGVRREAGEIDSPASQRLPFVQPQYVRGEPARTSYISIDFLCASSGACRQSSSFSLGFALVLLFYFSAARQRRQNRWAHPATSCSFSGRAHPAPTCRLKGSTRNLCKAARAAHVCAVTNPARECRTSSLLDARLR